MCALTSKFPIKRGQQKHSLDLQCPFHNGDCSFILWEAKDFFYGLCNCHNIYFRWNILEQNWQVAPKLWAKITKVPKVILLQTFSFVSFKKMKCILLSLPSIMNSVPAAKKNYWFIVRVSMSAPSPIKWQHSLNKIHFV